MKTITTIAFILCLNFISKSQTDGSYTLYHENGKVKTKGNFHNSKREGEWTYYHENGNLALKKNFTKGELTGEWAYFNEKGDVTMKVDDISKVREKAQLSYFKDGELVTKGVFVNNKKQGNWIKYDKNEHSVIKSKF